MKSYKMSREEKEYLSHYDISAYERPSIATDIVIFSILDDGVSDNIRKLPKKALKVLLIKRANYPYKDCWALPGGFAKFGEDVAETARRELSEDGIFIETKYRHCLTNEKSGLKLEAGLKQDKCFQNYHETVRYEIEESGGLAFDHGEIILSALLSLRSNVEKICRRHLICYRKRSH